MLFRVEMKLSNQAVPAMVDVLVVVAMTPRRADWTCIAAPGCCGERAARGGVDESAESTGAGHA